jgi:Leucine-rich repeat (LRR) protein
MAQQIIVASFKILLPGMAVRAAGVGEIVEIVLNKNTERLRHRTLQHRLEESIDLLTERLTSFESSEFSRLNEGTDAAAQKGLAISGIYRAMAAIDINPKTVVREKLDPDRLMSLIRPEALKYWQMERLSQAAIDYGDFYLNLACRYVVAIVRELPEFKDELLIDTSATIDKIYELMQQGIGTVILPRFRRGVPDEIASFEASYLSDIIQTYKDMELFGLTGLPPEFCRQPIDVAYIALQSAMLSNDNEAPLSDIGTGASNVADGQEVKRVHVVFESIVRANYATRDSHGRGTRILVTGPAGSGKTTVAHWLAIRAADHQFPDGLRMWNDCMPFIVPLRHVFRGGKRYYPTERDLIAASAMRETDVPGDWVRAQLKGRALVILDGVDELSELHRSDFRRWLNKLDEDFPLAHIVVTSRPDGLDRDWYKAHGFAHLGLQSMEPSDIRRCINAWFTAVIEADQRRAVNYQQKRMLLLADLERPAVRELAETPLLCAMLCAFYAHNLSAVAPQTRGDLYERVINTLVHTREVERSADHGTSVGLTLKAKLGLLQALGRYLTESSETTILCDHIGSDVSKKVPLESSPLTVKQVFEERLRGMTPIGASVDEVVEAILNRGVIFRRIAPNLAQFVHRSLQEYLAACEYADNDMVEELAAKANISEWRQIISFAAGKLKTPMASKLVSTLLNMSEDPAHDRRTMLLLAAQCYGAAGRLEPDVAQRTRAMLSAVLPPRDLEEAELISYAGEEILPWLEPQQEWSIGIAICCMRSASLIGGPSAMVTLGSYIDERSSDPRILSEFLHDWQYFDASQYARNILANLDLDRCVLIAETVAMIDAIPLIVGVRSVRVSCQDATINFAQWSHLSNLQEIDWPTSSPMHSLEGIGTLQQLKKLSLSNFRNLTDLGDLHQLKSVQELYLSGCHNLHNIDSLGELTSLKVLVLDGCVDIRDFTPIASLTNLRSLSLDKCRVSDLSFCANLHGLRTLRVKNNGLITNISGLRACNDIRRLHLSLGMRVESGLQLASNAPLEELSLSGSVSVYDIDSLASFTGLKRLSIDGISWLTSLSSLSDLRSLKRLAITNCTDLRDVSGIEDALDMEFIDFSHTDILGTYFARNMQKLTEVRLDHCRSLRDLSGLALLPKLEVVSVKGIYYADVEELRSASVNSGRLVILQESFYVEDGGVYGPGA